jgi:hypothetical protein
MIFYENLIEYWTIAWSMEGSRPFELFVATCELAPSRGWASLIGPSDEPTVQRPPIVFFDDQKILDWRLDPEESRSDFKMTVVHMKDGVPTTTTEYHLHRSIIALASNYFARLVTEGAQSNTVEIPALAAAVFPYFLDYLYGLYPNHWPVSMCHCDEGDDVGLYWLAQYFDVPQLRLHLEAELGNYILNNVGDEYISIAKELGVQPVLDFIFKAFAEQMGEYSFYDFELEKYAKVMDTQDLLSVVRDMRNGSECSLNASRLVKAFCAFHFMDADTFSRVTDVAVMPVIHHNAVWPLLEMERELFGDSATTNSLTSFQTRCIAAVAQCGPSTFMSLPSTGSFVWLAKFIRELLHELEADRADSTDV